MASFRLSLEDDGSDTNEFLNEAAFEVVGLFASDISTGAPHTHLESWELVKVRKQSRWNSWPHFNDTGVEDKPRLHVLHFASFDFGESILGDDESDDDIDRGGFTCVGE